MALHHSGDGGARVAQRVEMAPGPGGIETVPVKFLFNKVSIHHPKLPALVRFFSSVLGQRTFRPRSQMADGDGFPFRFVVVEMFWSLRLHLSSHLLSQALQDFTIRQSVGGGLEM